MALVTSTNLWKLKTRRNHLQRDPDFHGAPEWMSRGFVLILVLDGLTPRMVKNLSNLDHESGLNCLPDF